METFIKVIDKIISLIKARDENRSKLFKEIVEPLHTEFEKVVVQYFAFFRSTLPKLSQDSIEDVIESLKEQRNGYIQARIKLVSMTEAIKEELGNSDIVDYCNSVKNFFYLSDEDAIQSSAFNNPQMQRLVQYAQMQAVRTSRGSILLHMLESFFDEEGVGGDEKELQNVLTYIENSLGSMEESWSIASSHYAKLRVNYLLTQRI